MANKIWIVISLIALGSGCAEVTSEDGVDVGDKRYFKEDTGLSDPDPWDPRDPLNADKAPVDESEDEGTSADDGTGADDDVGEDTGEDTGSADYTEGEPCDAAQCPAGTYCRNDPNGSYECVTNPN